MTLKQPRRNFKKSQMPTKYSAMKTKDASTTNKGRKESKDKQLGEVKEEGSTTMTFSTNSSEVEVDTEEEANNTSNSTLEGVNKEEDNRDFISSRGVTNNSSRHPPLICL